MLNSVIIWRTFSPLKKLRIVLGGGLNFLTCVLGTVKEIVISSAAEFSTLTFEGVKNPNLAIGKHMEGTDQFFRLWQQTTTIKTPYPSLLHCDVCFLQLSAAPKRAPRCLKQVGISTRVAQCLCQPQNCLRPPLTGEGEMRASALPTALCPLHPQTVALLKGAF